MLNIFCDKHEMVITFTQTVIYEQGKVLIEKCDINQMIQLERVYSSRNTENCSRVYIKCTKALDWVVTADKQTSWNLTRILEKTFGWKSNESAAKCEKE